MYKTNDENQITPSLPRNAGWNVWTLLVDEPIIQNLIKVYVQSFWAI